jgi:hypothetical protein
MRRIVRVRRRGNESVSGVVRVMDFDSKHAMLSEDIYICCIYFVQQKASEHN